MVYHFSTTHPTGKTSLRLDRCLIKKRTKTVQVCLRQFCNHSRIFVIVLYFQVISINPYQLQLHLLAVRSFTDNHFQEQLFNRTHLQKTDSFSVYNLKQRKKRNSIWLNSRLLFWFETQNINTSPSHKKLYSFISIITETTNMEM